MSEKAKGKRYTEKEKARILSHVDKVNATKGRGGITAASEKYGVTPLTISNWLKKVGGGGLPRRRASGDFSDNLRRLADLHEAIAKKEAELTQLHREYNNLKKKL